MTIPVLATINRLIAIKRQEVGKSRLITLQWCTRNLHTHRLPSVSYHLLPLLPCLPTPLRVSPRAKALHQGCAKSQMASQSCRRLRLHVSGLAPTPRQLATASTELSGRHAATRRVFYARKSAPCANKHNAVTRWQTHALCTLK